MHRRFPVFVLKKSALCLHNNEIYIFATTSFDDENRNLDVKEVHHERRFVTVENLVGRH